MNFTSESKPWTSQAGTPESVAKSFRRLDRMDQATAAIAQHVARNLQPDEAAVYIVDNFWATIALEGPDGEDDYADNRYWLQRVRNALDLGADDMIELEDDQTVEAVEQLFTGHNLAEWLGETHTLRPGDPVHVFCIRQGPNEEEPLYFFTRTAGQSAMFPCVARMASGAAGSISTTCAYLYSVRTLDGETLASELLPIAPETARTPNCEYLAPVSDSPAIGYYDLDGHFHLYSVAQEVVKGATVLSLRGAAMDTDGLHLKVRKRTVMQDDTVDQADIIIDNKDIVQTWQVVCNDNGTFTITPLTTTKVLGG